MADKIDLDDIIDRTQTDSIKWNPEIIKQWYNLDDQLPLWVADMDFRVPQPVIDAMIQRAQHGIFGYAAEGESYYHAVIDWFKDRHHWEIQREWIQITPGIVPAINFFIQTYTNPGDKIIIQEPVYYPFKMGIVNNGRQVVNNNLILEEANEAGKGREGKYIMDFEDLKKKARDKRTRMLILCSPHNPVGRVWTREELQHLGDICLKNNILVIADEIHCDLLMPGQTHIPFASLSPEFAAITITCTAASKTFNLAGLHVSNIIISDPLIRNRFKTALENLGLMGANIFGRVAVEVAYRDGKVWLEDTLNYIHQNYQYLKSYIATHLPSVTVLPLEGTYLAWVDFRSIGIPPKALDEIIKHQAHVFLDDGGMFGESGLGFQRFNIACPQAILKEALDKITHAFNIYLVKQIIPEK
ncbi:MAG: pyridoxal phosphate-dependent aminotransferase [Promethearchaeota archaeon]|nr:MAG: pyridoxal phosphate-dependent aminotransferase [Candidatus Lokiarchaeota archaeon]